MITNPITILFYMLILMLSVVVLTYYGSIVIDWIRGKFLLITLLSTINKVMKVDAVKNDKNMLRMKQLIWKEFWFGDKDD